MGTGKRELNNNWKGGRRVTSHGYVEIKVDKGHPLRNANGYAYEHRIVAMEILGRMLVKSDIIHHKDENRQNNLKDNLIITDGNKGHKFYHRLPGSKLQGINEKNVFRKCACGCEKWILRYDTYGRPRAYSHGHNRRKVS